MQPLLQDERLLSEKHRDRGKTDGRTTRHGLVVAMDIPSSEYHDSDECDMNLSAMYGDR